MTRKHGNVSAEYCPEKDTIETIPLSRNRYLGTSENKRKENFPLLTYFSENMSIFYAICDKTVGVCDLITQKAEQLTNFRHFRLKLCVCSASAVGCSETFLTCYREQPVSSSKMGLLQPKPWGGGEKILPPPHFQISGAGDRPLPRLLRLCYREYL